MYNDANLHVFKKRKHPKFLNIFFLLTSDDEKIPTDRDLDNEIETLTWYMHVVYPLIKSIFKRKFKLFIKYKWKIALKKILILSTFIGLIYFGYSMYVRPTYQQIIIREKVSNIEKDIVNNPIPEANINFMVALSLLESQQNYKAQRTNSQYLGAYQMGDAARKAVGLSDMPYQLFLDNVVIQNWAMNQYMHKNYEALSDYIVKYNIPITGGIRVGFNLVTISGIIAAAHLVGAEPVKRFLDSNGKDVSSDGNGIPLTVYLQLNNFKLDFE